MSVPHYCCIQFFSSLIFCLILFQFLVPLLKFLVSMLILHGHMWPCQVSGCLRLLYPFRHIFSCSQKFLTFQYLLFLYLITLMSFPALDQHLLNHVQRIQNSCLCFSYCVRKYDTYLRIIRDLAGLKFGNVLFSICAVLYFLSFAPILLYICDISFGWCLWALFLF